ncbi:GLPGLI family protein [Profundicola chukchiensis]|nr:GLPGLI family protein [Profundicola chukchiensis]
MKYSFILILFLLSKLYAQDVIHVKYDLNDTRSLIEKPIKTELYSTSKESIFLINDKILDKNTLFINNASQIVGDTIDYVFEIFKDFNKNKIFSEAHFINLQNKIQVDDIDSFVWKKINESKYILGYLCKKAITEFRGREYEVFYCPEIESKDGPFKFSGLPGLILSVVEKNKRIEFVATSIDFNTQKSITSNLDIANAMSWNELLGRSKLRFWNNQVDLKNPVFYHSDEIEIYDLNIEPYIEIVYDVYSEFTYKENEKYHKEKTLNSNFMLSCNFSESNYKYLERINNNQSLTEFGRIKSSGTFYKNLLDSVYLNEMEIEGKRIIIKDNFQPINWEIHERYDDLLGFKIQKATIDMQEYSVEAWFTNMIKISNGPDKLYGLPGIILKSITRHKTSDQIDYVIANNVKLKNEVFKPDIPIKNKRTEILNEVQLAEFLKTIQW